MVKSNRGDISLRELLMALLAIVLFVVCSWGIYLLIKRLSAGI